MYPQRQGLARKGVLPTDARPGSSLTAANLPTKANGELVHLHELALPYDDCMKAQITDLSQNPSVPQPIGPELGLPKAPVPLRDGRASASNMVMPEAAVHEDGPLTSSVCDVGRSWQVRVRYTETMPE